MKEPKLRFKGFEGEWEETTFGNRLLSIQTGTNLLGSMDNKGIPLLKMGNIQRGYFSFDKLERLDESVTPAVNCIAKYGDFYYNTRNTLELVGKGATWMQKKGIFAFNSNIARCSLDGVNTIFFNYLYNTRNVIKQVQARAKGTTSVAAVYQRDLDSIEFSLPSVDEQKALGSFFQHLDSLIQSTTKKIESLKQVKAASLLSMFPQEGETTPRVRFKGFEGEWEKVKLGDVLTYEQPSKYLVTNTEYEKSGIPVLTAGKTFVLGYTSDTFGLYTDLPVIIFDDFTTESKFVDFLFKVKSSAMKMLNTIHDMDVDIKFVYEAMKNIQYRVENHQRHWLAVFSKITIKIPSIAEQRAIASYFTNLDHQINLQTQRLEKLKQIKAACLDKMFV